MSQPAGGAMPGAAHDSRALGTSQRIVVTDPGLLDAARAAVDTVVADVDAACSRFRDDSELMRLRADAGREVRVSPLLSRALDEALRAARLTDGAVDPTVGGALRGAGYDADFAAVPADGPAIRLRVEPVPGWRRIRHSRITGTVFVPEGVELDLGSTAKALCSDLAAAAAHAAMGGRGGVLVSLGGDIAVAGGAPPGGWRIQISDDHAAEADPGAEVVTVTEGGVATSSTTVRRWRRGGAELHHIIDPRTGQPARGPWRTVSVAAGSCLDANIAATAAVVLGAGAAAWLGGAGLPARLVSHTGEVVRIGGWPG